MTRRIVLARQTLRRIWSWKFVFYELLLPALRSAGAALGDAVLGYIGWLAISVRPRSKRLIRSSLRHTSDCARRRLVDRSDLAGARGQHRPVPGA